MFRLEPGCSRSGISCTRGFKLLISLAVQGPATSHDGDHHVGLKLRDLQGRQRVNTIGAVEDLLMGMRLSDFPGHSVDEVPDVIRYEPAVITLGRILPLAERALAGVDQGASYCAID